MEGESGVTRSIIDELHPSDIQRDHVLTESVVNRSIIDELHSGDNQGDQSEGHSGLLKVSLRNFLLRICKEIKFKVSVGLLEVS